MLPRFGERVVTEDGVQCHICGRFYKALGVHVFQAHGSSVRDYRKEFGLSHKGLIAESTLEKYRRNAERVDLVELGRPTRVTEQRDSLPPAAEGLRASTANLNLGYLPALEKKHEERRSRTECLHGHPYDAANTSFDPDGYRRCRACMRERAKRRRANQSGQTQGSMP